MGGLGDAVVNGDFKQQGLAQAREIHSPRVCRWSLLFFEVKAGYLWVQLRLLGRTMAITSISWDMACMIFAMYHLVIAAVLDPQPNRSTCGTTRILFWSNCCWILGASWLFGSNFQENLQIPSFFLHWTLNFFPISPWVFVSEFPQRLHQMLIFCELSMSHQDGHIKMVVFFVVSPNSDDVWGKHLHVVSPEV